MAGYWEYAARPGVKVLVGTLHVDIVPIAWAYGLKQLIIPGGAEPMGVTGMPYDMARNTLCMRALEGGFSHCFRSGTMVETEDGPVKIENLRVGDMVKTHRGRYRPVTETMNHALTTGGEVLWVKSRHSTIKCTPEHPFFVSRDGAAGRFIRASELRQGDAMLYPSSWSDDWLDFDIKFNTLGSNNDGKLGSVKNGQSLGRVPVTRDVARLLGLFLAEGCSTHDGLCFTFNNAERDYIDFVCRMFLLLCGRKCSVTVRHATNIKINVRALSPLFKSWFNHGARYKKIPEFVFGWNLSNRLSFLKGYFEGDGSVSRRTNVLSFVTSSKKLASGLMRLASSCGLSVKTRPVPAMTAVVAATGQVINGNGGVQGWFARKSSDKLMDLLEAEQDGGFLKIPIEMVEKHQLSWAAKNKNVYNLEVEEDHSYIADCAAVHNCFMLDSDVIPPPDTILRLLKHDKPVISGVYCRRSPPHGVPVMIKNGNWVTQFPTNSVIEVDFVGAGCLLIRRDVLEKLPPIMPGRHWFSWQVDLKGVVPPGENVSEDFAFNIQCRKKLGIPTLVDTSIQCLHVGLAEASYGKLLPVGSTPRQAA